MGLKTLLRASSVKWPAIPLLIAVWWLSSGISRGTGPAYWPDGTTVTAYCLFLTAPVCAGCAAWEAGRLRRGRVAALAPVRRRHLVHAWALLPVALLGLASAAVSLIAVRLTMGPAPGWPSLPVLGMVAGVLAAHTVIGFAAGNLLPPLLAAAVVLVLDYLWMALPPTFNTMWVRHLTGHLETGVPLTEDVNPAALAAPLLLAGGVAAGILLASASGRMRPAGVLLGVSCAVSAGALAYSLVSSWGPSAPPVPRADAMVCRGESPQVCMPRELAASVPVLRKAAREALPRLEAVGVERPEQLSYASRTDEANEADKAGKAGEVGRANRTAGRVWRLHLSPSLTGEQAGAAIAEAALPPLPHCPRKTDSSVGDARPLRAWLALTAGVRPETVTRTFGPDAVGRVASIRELPPSGQSAWFHRNADLLRRCAPAPETVVAAP